MGTVVRDMCGSTIKHEDKSVIKAISLWASGHLFSCAYVGRNEKVGRKVQDVLGSDRCHKAMPVSLRARARYACRQG